MPLIISVYSGTNIIDRVFAGTDLVFSHLLRPPPGYKLFFFDEFDYVGPPNLVKWGREVRPPATPAMVTVDGSKMIIRATGTNEATRVWGAVRTSDSAYMNAFKGPLDIDNMFKAPGWLEIRMKPSTVRGVMNEIVLWSDWHEDPLGSGHAHLVEVDVSEARGAFPSEIDISSHYWLQYDFLPEGEENVEQGGTVPTGADRYHQFVCWWDETFLRVYLDGRLVHDRNLIDQAFPLSGTALMLTMQLFIASDADGYAGELGIAYPVDAQMEVDYVRYYTPFSAPAGYFLVFEDEFGYTGPPDPLKWRMEDAGLADPTMVTVDGSKMIIRATGTNDGNRIWGAVRTSDSRYYNSWKDPKGLINMFENPGWIEISMKPSQVRGVMNELVMWTDYHEFPADSGEAHLAEIDLSEARGAFPTELSMSSHYWLQHNFVPEGQGNVEKGGIVQFDPDVEFHQFVCWWDTKFLRYFLDGELVHDRDLSDQLFPLSGTPMMLTMQLFIAAATDGYAGELGVAYPVDAQMEIDYVRVYHKATYVELSYVAEDYVS